MPTLSGGLHGDAGVAMGQSCTNGGNGANGPAGGNGVGASVLGDVMDAGWVHNVVMTESPAGQGRVVAVVAVKSGERVRVAVVAAEPARVVALEVAAAAAAALALH